MALTKSGGPAFPSFIKWGPKGGAGFGGEPAGKEGEITYYGGIHFRDYFAATVPLDIKINDQDLGEQIVGRPMPETDLEVIVWAYELEAKLRYMKADAMLKAREM